MLILASTSDLLRLTTDQNANLDVHASWTDDNAGTITPGRTNTLLTTAGTTTVVASPGASTYRTVKTLSARNRDASAACRVTVKHSDGSNVVELCQVSLEPAMSLHYDDHNGFAALRPPYGTHSAKHDRVWLDPAIGAFYTHVLPADVANSDATANRLLDVQDLQFSVREGQTYWFCYTLIYTSAATGTGSRWTIQGPGSPTALIYESEYSLTVTTKTSNEGQSTYDVPAASNASSAATGSNTAVIEGFIQPTCDGIVFPRFASEVLSSAITLKAGSIVNWIRTL